MDDIRGQLGKVDYRFPTDENPAVYNKAERREMGRLERGPPWEEMILSEKPLR
jgi:hypothetical protein